MVPSGDEASMDDEETQVYRPQSLPPEAWNAFAIGQIFAGRFRIEFELGSGAMGLVFAARDLQEGGRVALKVLVRDRDPESVERFRREAEILQQLHHPGIVELRAFGRAQEVPWIAMELLEGETLGARIRRKGALEIAEVLAVLAPVVEALEAAHAAGVIHRDLKPDQLFICRDADGSRRVVVLDFGLSSMSQLTRITQTGNLVGTPRYMAPELISSAKNASPASDVYALAVTLFEALTGESPFAASDKGQLLGAIVTGRHTSLKDLRPDLPLLINDVIRDALHRKPEDRIATPRELYRQLTQTGAQPKRLSRLSDVEPLSEASTQRRRLPIWALGLGALALVVLSAALTWWMMEMMMGQPQ